MIPTARALGPAGPDEGAAPTGAWRMIWLPLLMAALAAWWTVQPPAALEWAERTWHDRLLHAGATRPPPPEPVIVQIDERSLQQLGPWPWPRPLLAQLLQRLREAGARLQVWDLLLPEPAPGDAQLADQLAQGDVVLGQALVLDPDIDAPPYEGRLAPSPAPPDLCSPTPPPRGHLGPAVSLGAVEAGHINATPDRDGRLRRLPAVICDDQGHRYPQLALAVAAADEPQQAWERLPGRGWSEPAQWLQRGRWRFALDEHGWLPVPYQRPHNAWPAVSAASLLMPDAAQRAIGTPDLRDRIVLVGATALGVGDVATTPLHSHAPGVSVHAELIAQSLAAGAVATWPGAQPRARTALAGLTAALAGGVLLMVTRLLPSGPTLSSGRSWRGAWLLPRLLGIALALAVPPSVAWLAYRTAGGLLWPTAAPEVAVLIGAVLGAMLLLWHQRQQLRRLELALHSFVPAALARHIARQARHGGSLGHPQQGCLLGIHIQGLHAWVSQADTLQALALVHALHATIQQTARAHGGSVEYAQDGRYYLGWPSEPPTQCARAALTCARALHRQLQPVLLANERQHRPLSVWMALDCGSYLLGLVGTDDGRRGVLLGPLANDVAALLDLAPELAVPIVIAPAAEALLRQAAAADGLQSLGMFRLLDHPAPRELWWCAP